MGGMGGFVRGKTKLATYKALHATVRNRQEVENRTGLTMDAGVGSKADLYAQMQRDPDTNEWVLRYHFGK